MLETIANTVSLNSKGTDSTPGDSHSFDSTITADGRYVIFSSAAYSLINAIGGHLQVYRKDMKTNRITLLSQNNSAIPANDRSFQASISADGRRIVFTSKATNLTEGTTTQQERIYLR